MRSLIYFLATILCVQSCNSIPVVLSEHLPKPEPEPQFNFTYIIKDICPDPYPSIGSINHKTNYSLIGTGVLIAPNLVLTAAHVTENKGKVVWMETDGDIIYISDIVYYPEHTTYYQHDISILVLEENSDETPIELINPEKDIICKRMPITTVGHGHGIKRYSNPDIFWYYGRLISKPQFMIILPLKASIWFGDSGGAVLTDDNKLIGIMSYFAISDGVIFENGCTSIEYYKQWIEEIKNERSVERLVG